MATIGTGTLSKMITNIRAILLFIIALANATMGASVQPQPILIDTDIMSDVDDVGAIIIANVLHNCGLADLRGIAINTHSKYGSLAANVCGLSAGAAKHH